MLRLALFYLVASSYVQATCYTPSGLITSELVYQPCISVDGINSMCCALNRTEVGGVADVCLQNGLCKGEDGSLWRGFCTDKNWDSPGCVAKDVCDTAAGGNSDYSSVLTKCQDGTFCCGDGNTTCCSNSNGFELNPTLISLIVASSSDTSPTSSSTNSVSSSTSQCSPTSSPSPVTIGIGVGVPLAVLAALGSLSGFFFGRRRGRQYATSRIGDSHEENKDGYYAPLKAAQHMGQPDSIVALKHEPVGQTHELVGQTPVELGDGRNSVRY